MTAAKNLQVIRTIHNSTNFALQEKGEFQLAGCQILLSKQFHCDLQNRHKPYIPLLPSWLSKKDICGCFFFCWNPPNCLLLRKNCCTNATTNFLGGNMKAFKNRPRRWKTHLATKILLPDSNGNTAASRWPVTKACLCRRSDVTAFRFNFQSTFAVVFFFTSWDSYGFVMSFDGLSRTYKRRQSILGCPVVNGLFHPYN